MLILAKYQKYIIIATAKIYAIMPWQQLFRYYRFNVWHDTVLYYPYQLLPRYIHGSCLQKTTMANCRHDTSLTAAAKVLPWQPMPSTTITTYYQNTSMSTGNTKRHTMDFLRQKSIDASVNYSLLHR